MAWGTSGRPIGSFLRDISISQRRGGVQWPRFDQNGHILHAGMGVLRCQLDIKIWRLHFGRNDALDISKHRRCSPVGGGGRVVLVVVYIEERSLSGGLDYHACFERLGLALESTLISFSMSRPIRLSWKL